MFNAIYAAQHPKISCSMPNGGNIRILWPMLSFAGLDTSGKNIPNYHYEDLLAASKRYSEMGFNIPSSWWIPNHDNSGKQFKEQVPSWRKP